MLIQRESLEIVQEITKELGNRSVWSTNDLKKSATYLAINAQKPEEIKPFILSLVPIIQNLETEWEQKNKEQDYTASGEIRIVKRNAEYLMGGLLRKGQKYTEEEWMQLMTRIGDMLQYFSEHKIYYDPCDLPMNYIVKQIAGYLKKNDLSDTLRAFILEMLTWNTFIDPPKRKYFGSDVKKAVSNLRKLIKAESETFVPFQLKTEDIGEAVTEVIQNIKGDSKPYHDIFYLAMDVSGGKPSEKFQRAVAENIEKIGKDKYRKIAQAIIDIANKEPLKKKNLEYHMGTFTVVTYLCDTSKDFIKGIVWSMENFSDKETIRLLSRLAERSYTKIPGKGPALVAVGNACIYVLGNMRGKEGLGALSRLKLKIKQNNVKGVINNYLAEGARKYNVSVEELKEMAVPDFHMEDARKKIDFEAYELEVCVVGSKVKQQWLKPDGTTMKSVPSVVKNSESLTKKLKDIRKEIKDIQKVYTAQKQRIDNQFVLNRTWDFPSFEKYYIEHGLVSHIAKQLIWIFEKETQTSAAIFVNNEWQNARGETLDWVDKTVQVRLWHPVFATEEEIIAWRDKMMELEWKQPVKQAFRELYILTEAEINTRNYSNRMAAHILKQHQFRTLATLRDWRYSLMGAYDDGINNQVATKYLSKYGITAEYWIDELANDDAWNDAGIWLYVATDQVKFRNHQGVMDLADVPPIIFSEVMRDVDLFVGVASVGNDPEWQDNNGERQEQRDYWNRYSFGDLSEIAKTRKTILERLLPRLKKIRDKATIDGKFLRVEGDLRTYKIHIGSGNILMEPNDQYLCIVPSRSSDKTTEKLFIPFEGDRGLSIVLSKAFLLAEDTKITDTTITSQINRS